MNTQEKHGDTPLDEADGETADLLRKHGLSHNGPLSNRSECLIHRKEPSLGIFELGHI